MPLILFLELTLKFQLNVKLMVDNKVINLSLWDTGTEGMINILNNLITRIFWRGTADRLRQLAYPQTGKNFIIKMITN